MPSHSHTLFTTLRTEGPLLPADLLQRIVEGDADLGGLAPESYHLSREKLNEAINRSWNRLQGAWAAFSAAQAELPEADPGTSATRERWLLPLSHELGYGRLLAAKPVEEDRRALLRSELDAYYAHLYGLTRDELHYILDPKDVYGPDFPGETFRVLKETAGAGGVG
jgi:hypothetical protein